MADLRAERRIKLQLQGVGAHPWLLERLNGLARGIYNRLIEAGRVSSRQIPSDVQWCLNTMPSAEGFPAYQRLLGSHPIDLFGSGADNDDPLFTQDASLAGQSAQQRKLRMGAEEAALAEMA